MDNAELHVRALDLTNVREVIAHTLFALGASICALNAYLSFLRYPLYKLSGRKFQWVSGIPVFGSLLVVIALIIHHESWWLLASGIVLALFDTGGVHWFAGWLLWMYLFRRDKM
jgi:hypothetical protein